MPPPLRSETLFRGRTVTLRHVVCRHGRGGPGEEEWSAEPGIGFLAAGVFRRHGPRGEVLADPGTAVFFDRGEPYRVSHPVDGGDATTVLSFSRRAAAEAVARRTRTDAPAFPLPAVPAPAAAYALVQRLRRLSAQPGGRELEIEESGLALLDHFVARSRGAPPAPPAGGRPDAAAVRRRRADAVRQLLAAAPAERWTLPRIAREVAVSPFHLARGFRDETGSPIHRYLTRLRLRTALARVAVGRVTLLDVALDAGFAGHAHLTDAFRREFGVAPSRFRDAPSPAELAELRRILEARGAPGR